MNMQKKLLVIFLVFVIGVSLSGIAQAGWLGDATVENVSVTTTGNYTVRATSGATSLAFTIVSTEPNAKAMLATALTAASTGQLVNIEYGAGGIISRIMILGL